MVKTRQNSIDFTSRQIKSLKRRTGVCKRLKPPTEKRKKFIRSTRGKPKRRVEYELPDYTQWFDIDSINYIEEECADNIFIGYGQDKDALHQVYKTVRNKIVDLYRIDPTKFLTVTESIRKLGMDASIVMKVHSLLNYWGIINFQATNSFGERIYNKKLAEEVVELRGNQSNIHKRRVKLNFNQILDKNSTEPNVNTYYNNHSYNEYKVCENCSKQRFDLESTEDVVRFTSELNSGHYGAHMNYPLCSGCSNPCKSSYYILGPDTLGEVNNNVRNRGIWCSLCYGNSNYPITLSKDSFVRIDIPPRLSETISKLFKYNENMLNNATLNKINGRVDFRCNRLREKLLKSKKLNSNLSKNRINNNNNGNNNKIEDYTKQVVTSKTPVVNDDTNINNDNEPIIDNDNNNYSNVDNDRKVNESNNGYDNETIINTNTNNDNDNVINIDIKSNTIIDITNTTEVTTNVDDTSVTVDVDGGRTDDTVVNGVDLNGSVDVGNGLDSNINVNTSDKTEDTLSTMDRPEGNKEDERVVEVIPQEVISNNNDPQDVGTTSQPNESTHSEKLQPSISENVDDFRENSVAIASKRQPSYNKNHTLEKFRKIKKRKEIKGLRTPWTSEDFERLFEAIRKYGTDWQSVAQHLGEDSTPNECVFQFINAPLEKEVTSKLKLTTYMDPPSSKGLGSQFPFFDSPNTIVTLLSFCASVISPVVASYAAKAAFNTIVKSASKEKENSKPSEESGQAQPLSTHYSSGNDSVSSTANTSVVAGGGVTTSGSSVSNEINGVTNELQNGTVSPGISNSTGTSENKVDEVSGGDSGENGVKEADGNQLDTTNNVEGDTKQVNRPVRLVDGATLQKAAAAALGAAAERSRELCEKEEERLSQALPHLISLKIKRITEKLNRYNDNQDQMKSDQIHLEKELFRILKCKGFFQGTL